MHHDLLGHLMTLTCGELFVIAFQGRDACAAMRLAGWSMIDAW